MQRPGWSKQQVFAPLLNAAKCPDRTQVETEKQKASSKKPPKICQETGNESTTRSHSAVVKCEVYLLVNYVGPSFHP
jgi:hypothetical protein